MTDDPDPSAPRNPPPVDLRPEMAELIRREATLTRLNRALRTISAFHQLMIQAEDEPVFLQQACDLLVASNGYLLAWVGFAESGPDKLVRPVAQAGHDTGYLQKVRITWNDEPSGQGPTGTAIREKRSVICRDIRQDRNFAPWREPAVARGYVASISLPLHHRGTVLGTLNLYTAESGVFDTDEVKLLEELANDLAFGLTALRTRAANRTATEALRLNERRFRMMVEASPHGLCVVDAAGRITLANSRMETLFGYARGELTGQAVEELTPDCTRARHAQHREGYAAAPQVRRMGDRPSYPARRRDGTEFRVEISLHPLDMPEGSMTLATIADVTDRVHQEEARRRQDALFNSLASVIPDMLFVKDGQSRFIQINASMAQNYGLRSPAAAAGKSEADFLDERQARVIQEQEHAIMTTGNPVIDLEQKRVFPDGRVAWVSSTKVPIRDEQGRITGLVGISRDITKRKILEAQYLQSQKMDAFGQLAGGVAHDFNNILAAMMMQLNLLETEPGLPPAIARKLKSLETLTNRGARLTRQLLMFSRRQELEIQSLDLNALVKEIHGILERLIGENIVFRLKLDPEPLWIEADAGMIEQVIMNLCINSRDAMPEGGKLIVETRRDTPLIGAAGAGASACLIVSDSGHGMDAATQARIFEPFFTTKERGKGTGLGLATVYGIVQQHHGRVSVESTPGQGSTFRVLFPLHRPGQSDRSLTPPSRAMGGNESILVVEDDPAVLSMVVLSLRQAGYRVTEASHAADAIRAWEHNPRFDLLLTDFLMPEGMNGGQLAEHLRLKAPGLRVIVMSGYPATAEGQAAHWPAQVVRLAKPFPMGNLLETVRRCLDSPGFPRSTA